MRHGGTEARMDIHIEIPIFKALLIIIGSALVVIGYQRDDNKISGA